MAIKKTCQQFALIALVQLLAFQAGTVQSLQIMIKNQDWYCFGFQADFKTILDVDYLVTGVNPEEVVFEAVQSGKTIKQ